MAVKNCFIDNLFVMLSFLRVSFLLIIFVIPIYACKYKHRSVKRDVVVINNTNTITPPLKNNTTIIKPAKFIIGGTNAYLGEFPWQGLLLWTDLTGDSYLCGATLISSKYAMTAAHCADGMITSQSYLKFGIVNINSNSVRVGINAKFLHPNYVATEYEVHNDIAILQLAETVSMNLYVKPIILPATDSDKIQCTGVVSGWGYYYQNGQIINSSSSILQQATVSIISQSTCKQTWQDLDSSQICAGNYLKGTAPGDSGGPLQIFYNNTWYQVGITSYGASTDSGLINQNQYPGVYTRVSFYCDWIEKTTNGDAKCIDYSMTNTTITNVPNEDAKCGVDKLFHNKFLIFIFLVTLLQYK